MRYEDREKSAVKYLLDISNGMQKLIVKDMNKSLMIMTIFRNGMRLDKW